MTSELLSKLIPNQTNLPPTSPNKNQNENNQNYYIPQPFLNINAENFIPLKEKQKKMQQEFQQISLPGNNPSLISPSFSHYINPQRLIPYEDMLKKNIRSFNLLQNDSDNDTSLKNSIKEKCDLDTYSLEINFKFTCDYELIENDMREFLELFGEINSLDYDVNGNSIKINYKFYFSAMHVNYYLKYLLYENKNKNGNENFFIKKDYSDNENVKDNTEKISKNLDDKQNEEIVKFIKFLTDNYRNEPKIKNNENGNKTNEEKYINDNILNEDNKNGDITYFSNKKTTNINNINNTNNIEKKYYSNDNNNSKYLFVQQNSETPIKRTNTINNYSANNMIHNSNNRSNSIKKSPQYHSYAPPLPPFNPSIKTPVLYVPFVPKMNMFPMSIPVLFPMNSPFLNKSFYQVNTNKNDNNYTKNEKVENKINSCLVNNPSDNPINVNEKGENDNSQTQNDNKIKEFFEKMNNKIAIISNNSNNSTNSNEKNINHNDLNDNSDIQRGNGSNDKTNSEIGSNNNILSNKSDSTIKTEEVNKSSNTKSNNNSDENKRFTDNKNNITNNNNSIPNNINSMNSNNNSSSDKNSSLNFDVMSSLNGKTLSLERLNNFLQNSKPVSNFSNPILSLNSEKKPEPETKNEISNNNKNNEFNNNNPIKNNIPMNIPKMPEVRANKNNIYPMPMNNYFNSMFNFLFLSNFNQGQMKQIQKNLKPQLTNPNIYNIKPNPINFNKNVIDFNKLTLETKNKVHFMTHSSRNYCYKYVCNYTVQIENDNIFMVTKRIIGKNGCFLKKILQESCIKYGDYSTKIRLRGKGSGYIDKVSNSENSDEPLILSVSSLNYPTYYNCCLLVDSLMNKIYDDYFEHLHMILPKDLHYSIHKKQLIKNEFIVDRVNSMLSVYENKKSNMNENNNNNCNENEDKKVENSECCDNKK